jgi:phosphoglycerol transferase
VTRASRLLFWCAQPAVIALAVWLMLGGRNFDPRVPLALDHDASFAVAQAHATITKNLWWTNPDLAVLAPDDPLLMPQAAHVDQLLLRVVGLAITDPVRAVLATWLLTLALGGAASTWCLQRLGVSRPGAWCAGVLFALCPFALTRNTTYLGLTPYLVPFAATTALLLAGDRAAMLRGRTWFTLLAGNLLLALNASYFALGALVMFGIGTLAGYFRERRRAVLLAGASAVGIFAVVSLINVGPVLMARDPLDPERSFRDAANSEHYGLKLRSLVTPLPGHWFPPFRAWAEADARQGFPEDTESVNSRLGVIATVGFVGLLAVLLVPALTGSDEEDETIRTTSRLAFAATLVATVGGFGAVFSELATPHIRVFARMTPFIAFFALTGVALAIDRMTRQRQILRRALWAVVLLLGVMDQSVALRPVTASRAQVTEDYSQLRQLMMRVEARLPAGTLVYQLPARRSPLEPAANRMAPLDAFRPQSLSRGLRWSYPASSPALQRLQADAAATPARDLPALLAGRGVGAIVIDRFGYEDDGTAVLAELQSVAGATAMLMTTSRYAVLVVNPNR